MSFLPSTFSRLSLLSRPTSTSLLPSLSLSLSSPLVTSSSRGIKFAPKNHRNRKTLKGRIPIRTGGSTRGTTLAFGGEFGMRAKGEARLSAKTLEACYDVLRRKIKGNKGAQIFMRVFPDRPICVKGNETRMGKGKGTFEYWACNVPMNHMLFEIRGGNIRPEMAKDMCRVATVHLPIGTEFVTPESYPKCGNKVVPHPVAPLTLPPLTPSEILAEKAEEDLLTRFEGQVSISEKKTKMKLREEKRWEEFMEMLEKSQRDQEEREERERGGMPKKVKTTGLDGKPLLDPQFKPLGGKIYGKGVESAPPMSAR
ncbi:ribosomal protein L10e/L16 [Mrakia frigida]|uniref:mitochondrial 54S ribosomal protein uL16m MRPL16 n=1 Tax=Mrakia frigida TaxID=29902 RepID=UPI003FCC1A36